MITRINLVLNGGRLLQSNTQTKVDIFIVNFIYLQNYEN